MTKAQNYSGVVQPGRIVRPGKQHGLRLLASLLCASVLMLPSGCLSGPWKMTNYSSKDNEPGPDLFTLSAGGLFKERIPPGSVPAEMEKAKTLFVQKDYNAARSIFNRIAVTKDIPVGVAEEALYYEAECQRLRSYYPAAAEIYTQLVTTYPRGRYQKEALQRMFDIANYWLDETRDQMTAKMEHKEGKRSMVWPVSFVHMEKSKPFMDMEGRALALLEKIYLSDVDGPMGEKSLFYLGSVHFYRENYREADHFFHQVVEFHPNGKNAAKALELSILCKQMSTGGPEYDGRIVAEARELVHQAMNAFPELAHEKGDFLERQLYAINVQQAEKDLSVAEFYRRTKHPASAYFYYEIVRRRYPGTKQAEKAARRMDEIRVAAEKEQSGVTKGAFWFPNPFAKKTEPEPEQQPGKGMMPGAMMGTPQGYSSQAPGTPQAQPQPGYPQPGPGSYLPPAQGYPQTKPGSGYYPPAHLTSPVPPGGSMPPQGYPQPGSGGGYYPPSLQPPEPAPLPRPVLPPG